MLHNFWTKFGNFWSLCGQGAAFSMPDASLFLIWNGPKVIYPKYSKH